VAEIVCEGFTKFSCLHAAVENQETASESSESTDDSETSSDNDSSDKEEGKCACGVCKCLGLVC
jgi:hypothetical protein